MKGKIVKVRLSELHTQQFAVPTWEVPVLEAVHGDVQVVKDIEINRQPPEADDEYRRLLNLYRAATPDEGGVAYVAQVYGQHGPGVAALAAAIREAAGPEKKESGSEGSDAKPDGKKSKSA